MSLERRSFLKQAGIGSTALAVAANAMADDTKEKIVIGIIGTGGMGGNHVQTLADRKDVEIAYLCDVDEKRLANSVKHVESAQGKAPKAVKDLRAVIDDRRVQAVFIATPDHWHAPAAILALDAGKHVYVEKPCCHNIREGTLLVEAAKRNNKHVQVGTQSRSGEAIIDAIQRVQKGEVGDVLVAKAWNSQRRSTIGRSQPSPPPPHLDYDMWLGPVPETPYRKNLLPSMWRWWYDFGCGDIGNDGVHDIDVACWGLGVSTHPSVATCLGSKLFFDDDQQFPDTQYSVFEYAASPGHKKKQLIFEQRIWSPYVQDGYENGVAFYGTNGVMIVGHSVGWRMYGPRNKLIAERTGGADLVGHHNNFFDCVRGRQSTARADAAAGHRAATIVHLSNISARVGRTLRFDPQAEAILDDPAAQALVRRRYRENHWATPKGV